jgi:hypothetical protein
MHSKCFLVISSSPIANLKAIQTGKEHATSSEPAKFDLETISLRGPFVRDIASATTKSCSGVKGDMPLSTGSTNAAPSLGRDTLSLDMFSSAA